MPVRFVDLFDDILLRIAYECTGAEVVALERTCKTLRDVFSQPNRSLWMHLLRSLDVFNAPELPPYTNADSLSSHELRRLVTQAVDAHANWSTNSPSGPRVTRKCNINLLNKGRLLGELQLHGQNHENIKTVPGGKYLFLLWSEGYLQCWNTHKHEVIWTYPQLGTFQSTKVLMYDSEYDEQDDILSIVLIECGSEWEDPDTDYDVKVYKLNPVTKQAVLFKGARRRYNWPLPTRLITHGNIILIFDDLTVLVTTQSLKKWIPLMHDRILRDTIRAVDGYLIFMGKSYNSYVYKLFVIDMQRLFIEPYVLDLRTEQQEPSIPLSIESERLKNCVVYIPVLDPSTSRDVDDIASVYLSTYTPTWRESQSKVSTTIYVVCRLKELPTVKQVSETRFNLYSFRLTASSAVLPPSLASIEQSSTISIPLSHPYCTDRLHSVSHTGRALIASTNTVNNGVRYYAFSLERFFMQQTRRSISPILFGKYLVAPSQVYMEEYSGAIYYVSKDQKSLVIQYYN